MEGSIRPMRAKRFFPLLIAVILLSVGGIGTFAYLQLYEQRDVLGRNANYHITREVSQAFSMWLDNEVIMAKVLANALDAVDFCARPYDPYYHDGASAFLQRIYRATPSLVFLQIAAFSQDHTSAVVLEYDGANLQTHWEVPLKVPSSTEDNSYYYFDMVAEDSNTFLTQARFAGPAHERVFIIALPITDNTGFLIGALGVGIRLEYFSFSFIDRFALGRTGKLEMIDDRGFLIAGPEADRLLNPKDLPYGQDVLASLKDTHTEYFSLDVGGEPYTFTGTPIFSSYHTEGEWWIVLSQAGSELHQDLRNVRNLLVLLCSLAALFMGIMAFRTRTAVLMAEGEQSRRKEAELKKMFVDAAPYAIFLTSPDWIVGEVNPAACFLMEKQEDELVGMDVNDLIEVTLPPAFHTGLNKNVPAGLSWAYASANTMFCSDSCFRGQCSGRTRDGAFLTFIFDVCALEDGQRLIFLRDESELAIQREKTNMLSANLAISLEESERLRREAEHANAAKSEFLANMSHEMRTPLNAVIGITHILLQQQLESKVRQHAMTIHKAGKTLLGVINSVLDFSKIEAGKMVLETIPFNLHTVIAHLQDLFGQPVTDKSLHLIMTCDEDVPPYLIGDPLRLEQVLTNLLSNAVKFTEQGEIRLEVSCLDVEGSYAMLRFAVKDTGIGMSEDERTRLFRAFSQADTSTTRKYGGTGLGLAIAKRIAEMMGGTIQLFSIPGEGTEFVVTGRFPIDKEEIARENDLDAMDVYPDGTVADLEAVVRQHLCHKRILLVEDNPVNQDIAVELLQRVGVDVEVVENGQLAVEALTPVDHGFDLVLMDIQMPVMDGYEATCLIRGFPHNDVIPIIAMTAHAMTIERDKCLDAGMNGHLSKPIEVEFMYRSLCQWIHT